MSVFFVRLEGCRSVGRWRRRNKEAEGSNVDIGYIMLTIVREMYE
jgi:hypothetical protein